MIAQFQTPTVTLRSYSGDALNVVAQLPMIPGQGDQEVSSVVLIQKDAPQDLLIGTDLQPALDFVLTVRKSRNQEAVLLGITRVMHFRMEQQRKAANHKKVIL